MFSERKTKMFAESKNVVANNKQAFRRTAFKENKNYFTKAQNFAKQKVFLRSKSEFLFSIQMTMKIFFSRKTDSFVSLQICFSFKLLHLKIHVVFTVY